MNFQVTELAKQKILEFRPRPEANLRLKVQGGGCSGMTYDLAWADAPEPNDKIVLLGDIIIYIDSKSALFLENGELDYVESLVNAGFKINSNKFKQVCGCGESFSV